MPARQRLRVLITAGPTREYLDPVRYLSNDSSGRMGFAVAAVARKRGMQVTLVHGPVSLAPPRGVRARPVVSAADMWTTCAALWPMHDVLIMAAAVADYTPTRPARSKRKKSAQQLTINLKPTVDILSRLARKRRRDQVVIGFALEDRAPRRNAEKKLVDKQLDAIVLNRPDAIAAKNAALEVLKLGDRWREWPAAAKERQAARLIELATALAQERTDE